MINEPDLIVGIGEILWDILPDGKQAGGAPYNFVYHSKQSGIESVIISAVGQDSLGSALLTDVRKIGLADDHIQSNSFSTGKVTVKLDSKGQAEYNIHNNVAWDNILWTEEIEKLAKRSSVVCFGSLCQRNPESAETINKFLKNTKTDCIRIFDINLRQNYYSKKIIKSSLEKANVFKLNENELSIIVKLFNISGSLDEQLHHIMRIFKLDYIAYTMGSKGSILKSCVEELFFVAPIVEVADTVGAGDSFTAVLASGILLGIPLIEIHKRATEISAFVCTQKGANPPYKDKIF
jgi:fructokinase